MTAPLWITGPPTPAIGGRYGGPVPHSSYTTPWGTTVKGSAIAWRRTVDGVSCSIPQFGKRPCGGFPEVCPDLGEGHLERVEVGAIGRQELLDGACPHGWKASLLCRKPRALKVCCPSDGYHGEASAVLCAAGPCCGAPRAPRTSEQVRPPCLSPLQPVRRSSREGASQPELSRLGGPAAALGATPLLVRLPECPRPLPFATRCGRRRADQLEQLDQLDQGGAGPAGVPADCC